MLRLIRRELEDYMVLLVAAAVVPAIFVFSLVTYVTNRGFGDLPEIWVPDVMLKTFLILLFLPLGIALFSSAQMYVDKTRKAPAFLATLATNRGQILSAKILAGIFYILVAIVPIMVTDIILMHTYYPASIAGDGLFLKTFGLLFLACLMSFAVGLQIGASSNRIVAILGPIVVAPILLSIYVFKGFGWQTAGLFILITVAVFVRVWQKFKTSAL